MPDILPPQLVGVQQRPVYVRVRTALTVLSTVWLVSAVAGIGFFSGGTTSLALSLVLLYGTGAALIVVICALYRLVNRSAVKRTETRPEDAAAVAFVDTTRSATEELMAALRPAAETGRTRYAPASPRTVRPAAAGSDAEKPAAAVAATPAAAAPAQNVQKAPAKTQTGQPQGTSAGKNTQSKSVVNKSAAKKGQPAKSAPKASSKSALNKAVPNKTAPNKAAQGKPGQGTRAPGKNPPAKSGQAKGRPANTSGTKSAPAKRPGGSGERMPAKKQPSTKDSGSGPGPVASAQQCSSPIKATRPALVLASSNAMPQPSRQHVPDSAKRAS